MGVIVKLRNVRLLWPHFFTPTQYNNAGEFKYRCNLVLTPENPGIQLLEDATEQAGSETFGAQWPALKKKWTALNELPLRDGDTMRDGQDAYAGNMFISANGKQKPNVIDRDTSPLTEADDKCKSGDYVIASVEVYGLSKEKIKGVYVSPRWVQFFATGDRIAGGSPVSPDEYEDLSRGEDDANQYA